MPVTIAIVLRPPPAAGKLGTLALRLTLNRQTVFLTTGRKLLPAHWDGQPTAKAPNYRLLRTYLADRLAAAEKLVLEWETTGRPFTLAELKSQLQAGGQSVLALQAFAETSIARRSLQPKTRTAYQNSLALSLKLLPDRLPLASFNSEHVRMLQAAYHARGLHQNTVVKHVKLLRSVASEAHQSGLLPVHPFAGIRLAKVRSTKKAMAAKDLLAIENFAAVGSLDVVRRQFLFCCYTGVRFEDMRLLRWEMVKGHLLYFIPAKTAKQNISVAVPLLPAALAMLDIDTNGLLFKQSYTNQASNRMLHQLAELCGLPPFTFHASRHTFATMAARAGIHKEIIKLVLGHVKDETTASYIDLRGEAVAAAFGLGGQ
jgi:integrase